jgi:hypothetical protein
VLLGALLVALLGEGEVVLEDHEAADELRLVDVLLGVVAHELEERGVVGVGLELGGHLQVQGGLGDGRAGEEERELHCDGGGKAEGVRKLLELVKLFRTRARFTHAPGVWRSAMRRARVARVSVCDTQCKASAWNATHPAVFGVVGVCR